MSEIRINAGKAERIIAQMLRDEQGVHPADAVALAARICRRLATAMPNADDKASVNAAAQTTAPATFFTGLPAERLSADRPYCASRHVAPPRWTAESAIPWT